MSRRPFRWKVPGVPDNLTIFVIELFQGDSPAITLAQSSCEGFGARKSVNQDPQGSRKVATERKM
jgi:hypothetical protein